jgi:hypothetical protein
MARVGSVQSGDNLLNQMQNGSIGSLVRRGYAIADEKGRTVDTREWIAKNGTSGRSGLSRKEMVRMLQVGRRGG